MLEKVKKQGKEKLKDFFKSLGKVNKRMLATIIFGIGIEMAFGQDFDFSNVEKKITTAMGAFRILINIAGAAFCLIFIIRIALAYWGGGEEGRQDAGGMIKKLIIGILIWVVMYNIIDGLFGTKFSSGQ